MRGFIKLLYPLLLIYVAYKLVFFALEYLYSIMPSKVIYITKEDFKGDGDNEKV